MLNLLWQLIGLTQDVLKLKKAQINNMNRAFMF